MIWTIAIILIVLWALGFFTGTAGGLVHILLVLAVIAVVIELIRMSTRRGS